MKKISFILATILIFVILGCVQMGMAFAETVSPVDARSVLDDLTGSIIDGAEFDPNNYGYDNKKEPRVLAFSEFGFCYDVTKQDDYGIYVYVYNPSGQAIGDERNKISIATVYDSDNAVDYESFSLKLLSVSDGAYERLFYKFKVENISKLLARVSVNTTLRHYDVGELELNFGGAVTAFDISNYYEYNGFAKGYGPDANADSTLVCKSNSIESLGLDVSQTFYVYKNDTWGGTSLSSVYFGVPEKTLNDYGKLQQIKANWFETQTQPIAVFQDKKAYESLLPYVGISTDNSSFNFAGGVTDNGEVFTSVTGLMQYVTHDNGKTWSVMPNPILENRPYLTSVWNPSSSQISFWQSKTEESKKINGNNYLDYEQQFNFKKILWLLYSKDGEVSSEDVLKYMQDYSQKFNDDLLIEKYAKELFVARTCDGRQYGWQGEDGNGIVIDADSLFTIDGFTTGSKFQDWWYGLKYENLEMNPVKNIEPIHIVTDTEIAGSAEDVAKRLLIDENDVTDLKKTYTANKIRGQKTILFRFAVTPYTSYGPAVGAINYKGVAFQHSITAFLDFDVIWLKFVKGDVETVIPVVSSPIDVLSDVKQIPLETSSLWDIIAGKFINAWDWIVANWWVIPVGIVAAGVLIGLIIAFIKFGFKLVIKIIGKVLLFVLKLIGIILWFIVKWLPPGLIFTLLYYGIRGLKKNSKK